jgi:hypothetical protein
LRTSLFNFTYATSITTKKKNIHTGPQHHKTEWTTFKYCGKEVRRITELFKNTGIKIAFGTQNTIQNILKYNIQTDKYNSSGIVK